MSYISNPGYNTSVGNGITAITIGASTVVGTVAFSGTDVTYANNIFTFTGGGGGGGITSINSDSTSAQVIKGSGVVTSPTVNGTTTITVPSATPASLGLVSTPASGALTNTAGSIGVNVDNSSIKINGSNQLSLNLANANTFTAAQGMPDVLGITDPTLLPNSTKSLDLALANLYSSTSSQRAQYAGNINGLLVSGIYTPKASQGATLALGYPIAQWGLLEVISNPIAGDTSLNYTIQRYTSSDYGIGNSLYPSFEFVRIYNPNGATWSQWKQTSTVSGNLTTQNIAICNVDGIYYQQTSANATLALEYPVAGLTGVLKVYTGFQGIYVAPLQVTQIYYGSDNSEWSRTFITSWTPWTLIPTTSSGTFTPVINASTMGDLSVKYTDQFGGFTIIGNRCFVDLVVTGTITYTTAAGQLLVGGISVNPINSPIPIFYPIGESVNLNGITGAVSVGWTLANSQLQLAFKGANGTGYASLNSSGATITVSLSFSYQIAPLP